jgi:hypothetical protein
MKTILKLAIALVLLNATVRVGIVAWDYYQFKDAAQQEVTFAGRMPIDQITTRVFDKAVELRVPIARENIQVTRDDTLVHLDAFYTQTVELFPRYIYPLELSFSVEARALTGLK